MPRPRVQCRQQTRQRLSEGPRRQGKQHPAKRPAMVAARSLAKRQCCNAHRGYLAPYLPHSRRLAIFAPSTMARSFAQATSGCTSSPAPEVPKPQSVPAITRSRPTTDA